MKTYGVCIGNFINENNFIFCKATNKTEARKQGNVYRRQWGIAEPILKIVEIPANITDNNFCRQYAVTA